jgi:hypothetical protein
MHVDSHNVDLTPNVKVLFIQRNVYVYQGIREILDLHVLYVSLSHPWTVFNVLSIWLVAWSKRMFSF